VGGPFCEGTRHEIYEREKGNSNYDTRQCEQVLFKGWLSKGQSHFLQLNNIGMKTSKAKRSLLKVRWSSPLNQAVKGLVSLE
jgi:hypothetical protein